MTKAHHCPWIIPPKNRPYYSFRDWGVLVPSHFPSLQKCFIQHFRSLLGAAGPPQKLPGTNRPPRRSGLGLGGSAANRTPEVWSFPIGVVYKSTSSCGQNRKGRMELPKDGIWWLNILGWEVFWLNLMGVFFFEKESKIATRKHPKS